MGNYSITDLAELTGIKTHTLRMWEKRYGLLSPQRTDSNIRFYEDDDLTMLKLVQKLTQNGVRISRIAAMNLSEMEMECKRYASSHHENADHLAEGLSMFDVTTMENVLDKSIDEHGFESTWINLIEPFLHEIEVKFLAGEIEEAHETCFREMIKRKMLREIDTMPHQCSGPKVLLFLPKGNRQELSHLYMHYYLRKNGLCVTDMGCNVSTDCIKSAVQQMAFECIIVVDGDPTHWQFESMINELSQKTNLPILVSGKSMNRSWPINNEHIIHLEDTEETIRYVNRLRENLQNHLS